MEVDFKKIKKINNHISKVIKTRQKYKPLYDVLNKKFLEILKSTDLSDEEKEKEFKKIDKKYQEYEEKAYKKYELNNLNLNNEELKYIHFNEILEYDTTGELDLSNNNLTSLENFPKTTINIRDNPIDKKIIPYRVLDEKRLKKDTLIDKEYEYYIIPKGTLVFRQYHKIEDVTGGFVGFKLKEDDGNYYLHPEHRTFGIENPTFKSKFGGYGDIDVIFILQEDVKVFTTCHKSKEKYYKKCEKDISKTYNEDNKCLIQEFKDQGLMGWICVCDYKEKSFIPCQSKINMNNSLEYLKYTPLGIAQILLYPRKIREENDVVTKIDDFSESWMKKHLKEFNYKPFMIFDETVSSETYKSIFDKLLSIEGFTNEDGTFHVTVNKIDGTYVLSEEANEDILKDCVPLSQDRVEYLKEYVASQK